MEDVEVKEAGKKGKGLFANKNFRKGEKILYWKGKTIETDDPSKFSPEIRDHWHPIDQKGKKIVYILPEEPWMYMNHSCEPNAGIKNNRTLVAMRLVKKGEEILIDYSTLFIEGWEMDCKCGSKTCRKKILTFDKLSKKDKDRLKDYVTTYVKKKYTKS